MSDEKLVNKIIDLELALIAAKDENTELKAKIEKVSGDALSNYYENVELKAKVAKLEADIKNNKGGIFAYDANGEAWVRLGFKIVKDSEANSMEADAIIKAISTLGTHWADNIGEEVIRVELLERYAEKVRRGEA